LLELSWLHRLGRRSAGIKLVKALGSLGQLLAQS